MGRAEWMTDKRRRLTRLVLRRSDADTGPDAADAADAAAAQTRRRRS